MSHSSDDDEVRVCIVFSSMNYTIFTFKAAGQSDICGVHHHDTAAEDDVPLFRQREPDEMHSKYEVIPLI